MLGFNQKELVFWGVQVIMKLMFIIYQIGLLWRMLERCFLLVLEIEKVKSIDMVMKLFGHHLLGAHQKLVQQILMSINGVLCVLVETWVFLSA